MVLGKSRRVRTWDDVSEFTRPATTLRTGFLNMHAGKQRCSAAHTRMTTSFIVQYLGWQARNRVLGHLPEMATIR